MKTMKAEAALALTALTVVAAVLWSARDLPAKAAMFPVLTGGALGLLLLVQLAVASLGRNRGEDAGVMDIRIGAGHERSDVIRKGAVFFLWLFAFFMAVVLFGFAVGGVAALFAYVKFGFGERWLVALALAAGAGTVLYLAAHFLRTPLSQGLLL